MRGALVAIVDPKRARVHDPRGHTHTIPGPRDQRANRKRRGSKVGRPIGFDSETYKTYKRRNEVERTINRLKNFRDIATRSDKRAHVFHGTVTTAAIR